MGRVLDKPDGRAHRWRPASPRADRHDRSGDNLTVAPPHPV